MDKKDLKILSNLQYDARLPLTKIAKEVALSSDSVKYRLQGLEKAGIMQGSFCYLNFHKLGYIDYGVYLSTVSLSTEIKEEIIAHITKHKHVHYFSETGGSYNFIIGILAKNPPEFNDIFESLIMPFYQYIYSKEIIIRLDLTQYSRAFFDSSKKQLSSRFGGSLEDFYLDEKNTVILQELTKDARTKIVDIANKLSVPSSSVIQRINSLEKQGIITGYFPNINLSSQGYQVYNLTLRLVFTTNSIHSLLKGFCQTNQHTLWLIQTMGDWDFELGIEVLHQQELQKIIDELKEKIPQIAKIDFVTIFTLHKYSCFPF